jgi:predicted phage-related endonuclease
MNAPLTLSPDALAAISVPEGIDATPITSREQWLLQRKFFVTASVAAALWGDGVHPYVTAYQLWAEKSGLVSEEKAETPAMRRGRLLEPVLLQLLREDFPTWTIVPCTKFYSDAKARIGATPDFLATRPDRVGLGIIQGKTAGKFAFRKGWTDADGDLAVPTWVGIQASVEASLTGASWAAVAAMSLGDGGLDLHVEDVPLLPALVGKLRTHVAGFWKRVEIGEPYPMDFNRDAALISQIYADDDGSEIDLSGSNRIVEIVSRREMLKVVEASGSRAEKERKIVDAEILAALGNAARGRLDDGRLIEAKTVRRKAYEVKPSTYRAVKVRAA